jgi:putative ABC transport system permease protein
MMEKQRAEMDHRQPAPHQRAFNRNMFWRVLRRSVFANRGRLLVILLALGSGSAVTAALLNLQIDAKRRIRSDFSALGPSAVIVPGDGASTFAESVFDQLPVGGPLAGAQASLSLIGDVAPESSGQNRLRAVVTGTRRRQAEGPSGGAARRAAASRLDDDRQGCAAGGRVASRLDLKAGDRIVLGNDGREEPCTIKSVVHTGDARDDQIMPQLEVAQRLAGAPGRVSVIELSFEGRRAEQDAYLRDLQQRFPALQVRGLGEFSSAQFNVYNRISGILTLTVLVVLLLTALCVMAAMTNVAMERRNDVGLMKAIGGPVRRVLRLFLAEAVLLGLAGGLLGSLLGMGLSIGLGKAVFGVAAEPRLIVYPISVALTVIVAILAAYPLRRLAQIRPASVFRGQE